MDNQQKMMQLLVSYIAQKTGAKSQKDVEATLQKLGQEGISKILGSDEFKQFVAGQAQSAKLGAKLSMQRCPKGSSLVLFKTGGKTKCGCKKGEEGPRVPKPANKRINPNDTVNTKFGPRATGDKPVTDPRTKQVYKPVSKQEYRKLSDSKKVDISLKSKTDKCGGKLKKLKKNQNGGILIPESFRKMFNK